MNYRRIAMGIGMTALLLLLGLVVVSIILNSDSNLVSNRDTQSGTISPVEIFGFGANFRGPSKTTDSGIKIFGESELDRELAIISEFTGQLLNSTGAQTNENQVEIWFVTNISIEELSELQEEDGEFQQVDGIARSGRFIYLTADARVSFESPTALRNNLRTNLAVALPEINLEQIPLAFELESELAKATSQLPRSTSQIEFIVPTEADVFRGAFSEVNPSQLSNLTERLAESGWMLTSSSERERDATTGAITQTEIYTRKFETYSQELTIFSLDTAELSGDCLTELESGFCDAEAIFKGSGYYLQLLASEQFK